MGIFDAVIGNLDRHRGNWLNSQSGRLYGIDHGYAFGDSPIGRAGVAELRSWALAGIKAGDLSADEQREIGARLEAVDWDSLLAGSHLQERERASLVERAAFVADKLRDGKAHEINATFKADPD
jgi:hypothetical protein